tara:strand:- start:191 stop:334 length:144 start_codon:yes stop_codon:yes gene_type:complete
MENIAIYAPYIAVFIAILIIFKIRKDNRDRIDPPAGPKKPGGGGGKK